MTENENRLEAHTPIEADTFVAYESLPRSERERRVWFWPTPWYKTPYALRFEVELLNPKNTMLSEWAKLSAFLKREYPIQFRVRDCLENIEIWYDHSFIPSIRGFWKDWIVGRRVEMRKKVFRREWRDLDTIIIDFHAQCLIEFVEREKGLSEIDYTQTEEDIAFASELQEQYDYATRGRELLKDKIQQSLEKASSAWNGRIEIYRESDELQAQLDEKDTQMCNWVVKNRSRLWT